MKKLILLTSLCLVTLNGANFSKSKKTLLKKVYHDHMTTFYCDNPYEIRKVKGKQKALIVRDEAYYSPRKPFYKSGKPNTRAQRVEWEHVVPAHNFGKHLACWKNGGRKACKKDKTFKGMEADMHNLVPAIGEVNGDRSNYRYGADKPTVGQYGKCEVQVNFKAKRAYVKKDIRGDIARTYFYMSDKYKMRMSKQERKMMEAWAKADPVSDWERIRNRRIGEIQGNLNTHVK